MKHRPGTHAKNSRSIYTLQLSISLGGKYYSSITSVRFRRLLSFDLAGYNLLFVNCFEHLATTSDGRLGK
jgi:hypothetical protein